MIQLIKKEGASWHMIIHGVECTFFQMSLYIGNNLFPVNPNTDHGLRWRVNRKWVSYRQVKKSIAEYRRREAQVETRAVTKTIAMKNILML